MTQETQLREALRDAADRLPPPGGDLDGIVDAAVGRIRRRRVVGVASLVALVALGGAVVVGVVTGGADLRIDDIAGPGQEPDTAPGAPEQPGGPYDPDAQMRDDLMWVDPPVVDPGETVRLVFPEATERGIAYVLEEETEGGWVLRYFLDAGESQDDRPVWWPAEDPDRYDWPDIGIAGPGPNFIEIPATATPGDYRICTANAVSNFCAPVIIRPKDPPAGRIDLPEPIPVQIVAAGWRASIAVVELQTGRSQVHRAERTGLTEDALDGLLVTPTGELVAWQHGVIRVLNPELDGVRLTIRPELVNHGPGIAPSLNLLPTADGRAIWVIQARFSRGDLDLTSRADLIDLGDGTTIRTVELSADIGWHHAAGDGFVTTRWEMYDTGDGWTSRRQDDRTIWVDTDGRVQDVGPGAPIAATSGHVLRHHCPDDCELWLTDLTAQTDVLIEPPAEGTWWPVSGPRGSTNAGPLEVTSPDGRHALVGLAQRLDANGQPERLHLVLIDLHTAIADIVHDAADLRIVANMPVVSWSPDGQWIVIVGDRDLELVHLHTRQNHYYEQTIPAQHWVLSAGPAP